MPYVLRGKCVYKKDTGEKVGCAKPGTNPKDYLAVLNMREHGVPEKPKKGGKK